MPRRLARLPAADSFDRRRTARAGAAGAVTRLRGWRTVARTEAGGVVTVAAEKGYLRETGNLLFHAALVVLLVGVAVGKLWSATRAPCCSPRAAGHLQRGAALRLVPPGAAGRRVRLAPFCIDSLDKFSVDYDPDGTPAQFRADITYSPGQDGAERNDVLEVNHPLRVEGAGSISSATASPPASRSPGRTAPGSKDLSAPFLPQDPTHPAVRGRGEAARTRSSRSWLRTARSLLSPPSARTGS